MKHTKLISMCLCLLLCFSSLLVACNNEGEGENSKGAVSNQQVNTGYDPATGRYVVSMPEFTWTDKTTFTVCVTSDEVQTTYFSEEVDPDLYETTDAKLKDAVKARNDEIEEDYGIKIVAEPVKAVGEAVRLDASSDSGLYDAAMPFMREAAVLAQEGYLYNLYDFTDYLHLDQAWWDQGAEESLSVKDKLYFTTGDISIMPKIVSIAVTFNKEILKSKFPGTDLYEMVKNKEWTFDTMIEMSKECTVDSDGVQGYSYEDEWGLSSSWGDASMLYLASGKSYITKNSDNEPELAFDDEASISVAKNILEQLQLKDEWCFHCNVIEPSQRWEVSLDVFGQNRALFRTSAFSAIKKLRAYADADEFGLIPLPLMTKDQDTYYTPCNTALAFCVAIPFSLDEEDAKFSAYMLELMAVGAKNYITPAYYESTLKQRDLKDDESEEMLDEYIFSNIVYDLGIVYNFGNVSSMLETLMSTNSADIASTLESGKDAIELAIEECLLAYD